MTEIIILLQMGMGSKKNPQFPQQKTILTQIRGRKELDSVSSLHHLTTIAPAPWINILCGLDTNSSGV